MNKYNFFNKKIYTKLCVIALLFFVFSTNAIALGVPTILSFQGRLADSGGNLLGGAGTTYYFKFSIWDNGTVGSGARQWPASAPSVSSSTVRQGVFSVDIGDTTAGYPDALDYNFNTNDSIYLQIEVATTSAGTYQTLSPRKKITSSAFSQLSGAVSGVGQSSFGTTTPISGSVVSVVSTSTNSTAVTIQAFLAQVANLLQIQDSTGANIFTIDANGSLSASGTIFAANFSGTSTNVNTGDESSSTIKTKLGVASSTNDGYLSATDWDIFNNKLSTSTASSTYAQLAGATFTGPISSTNLSGSNTGDVSLFNNTNGLTIFNQVLTMGLSGTSATGTLSATDWNTFNDKLSTSTAAATYLTIASATSTYLSILDAIADYVSTSTLTANYVPYSYASSTFPTFTYASGTFATISSLSGYVSTTSIAADYFSTSTITSTYPTFTYASSTFLSFAYASSTFASTSYITANYVPYSYASSTFPTFGYASSSFPTFSYASSTYELLDNKSTNVLLGASNTLYPTQNAVKTYVDNLSLGLNWQNPIELINLIAATDTPPASPVNGDIYLINTGGVTGAWSGFAVGDLVRYNSGWAVVEPTAIGDRYGIAFNSTTTPYGDFTGYKNYTFQVASGTPGAFNYIFTAPANNNALNVENASSTYNGNSFVYSSTLGEWVQLSASTNYTFGNGLSNVANLISLGDLTSNWNQTGLFDITTAGRISAVNLSATNTGDVTLANNINGLTISGQTLTMGLSGTSATGTLSATDWNTFNDKLSTSTAATTYLTIASATSTYPTFTYASSTFLSFAYASSTFASTSYVTATYVPYSYASTTFPSFSYASSTYATVGSYPTYTYASSTFLTLSSASADYVSTSTLASTLSAYLSTTTASTTYAKLSGATFTGSITSTNLSGSNTGDVSIFNGGNGLTILNQVLTMGLSGTSATGTLSATDWNTFNDKLSTSTAATTYLTIASATSTYPTFTYASSTFPSFAYASSTYATVGSYPTYTYASSTFPSFSYASSTFVTYGYGSSTYALLGSTPSYTYASSTFPSFSYASGTFATIANYPTYTYASSTFPTFAYASSAFQTTLTNPVTGTGATNTLAYWTSANTVGTLASVDGLLLRASSTSATGFDWVTASSTGVTPVWGAITGTLSNQTDLQNALNAKLSTTSAASTYLTIASATSTYPTFTYASSTFPSFAYASSTYATVGSYPTYTYASSTFVTYGYGSSTYALLGSTPSYTYASSTFPSFSYASGTFATIANYPTYTYASSTFPTFAYASSAFQTTLTNPVTGTGATNTLAYWNSAGTISTLASIDGLFLRASSTSATGFDWVSAAASGTAAVWGTITGTLSNQTDLQAALDAKLSTTSASVNYVSTSTLTTNYLPYSYASSTFVTYGYGSSTYALLGSTPSYTYASSTFPSFSYASSTFAQLAGATFTGGISATNFSGTSTGSNSGDVTLANNINGLTISGQALTMGLAGTSATGTLSATDWNTFNNKLSTTSAAADYVSTSTLTSTLSAYLSTTTASTTYAKLSGATFTGSITSTNLSGSNTGDVSLFNNTNGLTILGQVLTLGLAGTSATGTLSATDWNTFNNKVSNTYASSTFPSFSYASSTFATISSLGGYVSTTTLAADYLSTSTASSTYAKLSGATFTGSITSTNLSGSNTGDVSLFNNTNGLTILGQVLTLGLAGTSATGTLSATDWNTFNNKLSTTSAASTYLTIANATSTYVPYSYASSTFVTYGYGSSTYALLGSTPSYTYASSTFPSFGYASSTYAQLAGATFTGGISAINFSGTSTGVNSGDVTLVNNINGLTISGQALTMGLAGTAATGTLSAIDWNTFNNKLSTTSAASTYLTLAASTSLAYIPSASSSTFLSTTTAASTYLTIATASSTYAKLAGAVFTGVISATNLSGTSTGSNSGDVTLVNNINGLTISGQALTMGLAGTSATGTLSATDWNTFNNKLSTTSAASTYLTIASATSTYPTFTYASSTFPSFAYGTSTYQTKLTNPVTGTGATNTLAYWTSANTVGTLATGTAGTFLRASSTSATGFDWVAAGGGSVTAVTVTTANGVSASVANQGTTPALTFTLGNITPTTVNGLTFATTTTGFTISTTSQALSVIGSSTVSGSNTGDVTLANNINGLTISGQALTMGLSGTSATGTLSATDWNTFNNKVSTSSQATTLLSYLSTTTASSTYLKISDATSTYMTYAYASSTFATNASALSAYKLTDTATTTTTLMSDTELVATLAASSTYFVNSDLFLDNANSVTPDLKVALLGASGWTCSLLVDGVAGGSVFTTAYTTDCDNAPTAATIGTVAADGGGYSGAVHGWITTTTGGTITFQWATRISATLTLKKGSRLTFTKVSGADLAEIYYTNDGSIAPGDVVALDDTLSAGVKKSSTPYDSQTLGVISTSPGLLLGDTVGSSQGAPVKVALSGRVPVKVSTENGPIKAGDLLTQSSIPGVAMRATKAGTIIGQSLTPYDGEGVGQAIVFIKNGYSNGAKLADILPEGSTDLGKVALAKFLTEKEQLSNSVNLSEISTDRLSAGLEIITPTVVTDTLDTKNIVIGSNDGKLYFTNASSTASSSSLITFDSLGNASFAGEITADKISANSIKGLDIITDKISSLSTTVDGLATTTTWATSDSMSSLVGFVNNLFASSTLFAERLNTLESQLSNLATVLGYDSGATTSVKDVLDGQTIKIEDINSRLATLEDNKNLNLESLSVLNGLSVSGNAVLSGGLSVDSIGSVNELLSINGDVEFFGRPYFTTDTGGSAVIVAGTKKVDIVFDKDFVEAPIVSATIALDSNSSNDAQEQEIFDNNISLIVTKKGVHGFTIAINKTLTSDISFNWIALAVKNAKVFTSKSNEEAPIVQVVPTTTLDTPTTTPDVTPPISEVATTTPDTATSTLDTSTATPDVTIPTPEVASTTSDTSTSTADEVLNIN